MTFTPVFLYGSLMDSRVLSHVLGEGPISLEDISQPAKILGYRRVSARGVPYPVLVPEPGSATEGLLFFPEYKSDLDRIDFFERDEYVPVLETARSVGRSYTCWVYMPNPEAENPLEPLAMPWSMDRFISSQRFSVFLDQVLTWMKDFPEG